MITACGTEPLMGADYGYDSFKVLIEAYDEDSEKWIENMQNTNFDSVTGHIEFDETGARAPEYRFDTIQNGELPV